MTLLAEPFDRQRRQRTLRREVRVSIGVGVGVMSQVARPVAGEAQENQLPGDGAADRVPSRILRVAVADGSVHRSRGPPCRGRSTQAVDEHPEQQRHRPAAHAAITATLDRDQRHEQTGQSARRSPATDGVRDFTLGVGEGQGSLTRSCRLETRRGPVRVRSRPCGADRADRASTRSRRAR